MQLVGSPSSCECGVPAISPNAMSRIVGGSEANVHSWPWMVSVQNSQVHQCGGSLINNLWVVSAAHCHVVFYGGGQNEIVAGLHRKSEVDSSVQRIEIEEIIVHERYQSTSSFDHDIMLLKLAQPVEFSDFVSPVCLPGPSNEFTEGMRCYTTGWGNTRQSGSSPDELLQVMVPLLSTEDCNQSGWYDGAIDETMVCAGYQEGGRDSCQGDSGGPLVCNEDGVWTLAGVVSWGAGCAQENRPGVYANVTNLLQWVETTVQQNS
ncbi:hypothetical protein CAPTEDRAFT_213986 [Capitella teleta]|uniref:Peptidase S1 domain-containing protein n=1 Tax=Capitella teleta TaxID=283909 RepID=R7TNR1_CAPTE|nr:hypothetical protein CAPTEDRAFT_213986 [Capitella teleta]|eukprot:ELT95274.1 hypothetical protein CAPTEDRAFT_213986 [Capitella teleta]